MAFTEDVLKLTAEYDLFEEVIWDDKLNFFTLCNDVFVWACADGEEITPESLPVLRQSLEDYHDYGCILYACRMRKCRPQGAYYKYFDHDKWHLFHECGPERVTGLGNPNDPEEFAEQVDKQA